MKAKSKYKVYVSMFDLEVDSQVVTREKPENTSPFLSSVFAFLHVVVSASYCGLRKTCS